MTVERGWLIEKGASSTAAPLYWNGDPVEVGWTTDVDQAIRFARKLDAERVADGLLIIVAVRVVEHRWG